MAMSYEALHADLQAAFPDATIELIDTVGDGDHWKAKIVSARFAGLPRVRQHQLVYAALGDKMGGVLHALALETSAS